MIVYTVLYYKYANPSHRPTRPRRRRRQFHFKGKRRRQIRAQRQSSNLKCKSVESATAECGAIRGRTAAGRGSHAGFGVIYVYVKNQMKKWRINGETYCVKLRNRIH